MTKDQKQKQVKSTASRVKESVDLVKKIQGLGITDAEPGFLELREKLNEWIRGGPAWAGKVEFARYGRYVELILPEREGVAMTAALKIHPWAAKEIAEQNANAV